MRFNSFLREAVMDNRQGSPKNFAFYHQNEALLLQFLIHECLRTQEILMKRAAPHLLLQVIGNLEISRVQWQAPLGHLPRLIHYCTLLCDHFKKSESDHCMKLQAALERAYGEAKKYEELGHDKKRFAKLYATLRKEITLFFRLLLARLFEFRDDATILYFLLCHQEQIDTCCKQPFTKKIFDQFFPKGLSQAHLFLAEKFTKKGFNHLIPLIEKKLRQLEKA